MVKYGIIFDMDGTLWDSAEGVVASWNEIIEKEYSPEKTITTKEMIVRIRLEILADPSIMRVSAAVPVPLSLNKSGRAK